MIVILDNGDRLCLGQQPFDKLKVEQLLGGKEEVIWIEDGHCGDGQSNFDYCL